ncbi:MAG: energy transducer TonB [Pseudomonadota bacterium]
MANFIGNFAVFRRCVALAALTILISGGAGSGAGASDLTEADRQARTHYGQWIGVVLTLVQRYPPAALSARLEGSGEILLEINRSGEIIRSEISRSTGHEILDAEMLTMALRLGTLPRFTPAIERDTVIMKIPITFIFR